MKPGNKIALKNQRHNKVKVNRVSTVIKILTAVGKTRGVFL